MGLMAPLAETKQEIKTQYLILHTSYSEAGFQIQIAMLPGGLENSITSWERKKRGNGENEVNGNPINNTQKL